MLKSKTAAPVRSTHSAASGLRSSTPTRGETAFDGEMMRQPDNVLQLQGLVGNAATQRLLRQTPARLQRASHVREDEDGVQTMSPGEHRQVIDAVHFLLTEMESLPLEEQQRKMQAFLTINDAQYHVLLMHWYRVVTGRFETTPGVVSTTPGTELLCEISRAESLMKPILSGIQQGHGTNASWVSGIYRAKVSYYRQKRIQQAADESIGAEANNGNGLLAPDILRQEQEISNHLLTTVSKLKDVTDLLSAAGSAKIGDAFDNVLEEGITDEISHNIQSKKGLVMFGEMASVLGMVVEVWKLQDPKERVKLFDKKLWPITNYANLVSKIFTMLQGSLSLTMLGVATLAKVAGNTTVFVSSLAAARGISGKIGSITAPISLITSSLSLLQAENTLDRGSAMLDMIGAAAGVAGMFGAEAATTGGIAIGAAYAKFLILPVMDESAKMAKAGFEWDVMQALKKLNSTGRHIADSYNYAQAAIQLMVEAQNESLRAAYEAKVEEKRLSLYHAMKMLYLSKDKTGEGEIGQYAAITTRLNGLGPQLNPDAPVGSLLRQARAAVHLITEMGMERKTILKEAYEQNPNATWMQETGFGASED